MEQINHTLLSKIDSRVGSPFFIMQPEVYAANVMSFRNAFEQRYPRLVVGYSFKTNYVPALCKKGKELGCYAEVVSEFEYQLALAIGFENIIFNGPIKTERCLIDALERGAIVNLDSEYEIDTVCNFKQNNPEKSISVGLRINIMLTDDSGNSVIQCGLRSGRFGFPETIIGKNIERLKAAGIRIISLHGHTSSSDRAVNNYKIIAENMLKICKLYDLNDIAFFDVGGGFFGAPAAGINVTNKPQYVDYANAILDVVLGDTWFIMVQPNIVIEPGSSVVSNVFSYVTKIYQNKTIGGVNYVTVDGSVFDVKPTMHSYNLPFKVYGVTDNDTMKTCDVVGSTCMEKDVIMKGVEMPAVHKDDYIMIDGVGSYTISLTPTFINYLPAIVYFENKSLCIARRRQEMKDVLSIYNY